MTPRSTCGAALSAELRPRQWVKNVFVLAPVFFGRQALAPGALARALAAFGCFCAVSSAAYLLNDWADREQDRLHPLKRLRPIASGLLAPRTALDWAAALLAAGLAGGLALGPPVALILAAYGALSAGYSLHLRQRVLLDVFTLSAGFVLRVAAGGVAAGVALSPWLLLCTLLLSLFLGFCKRRHEFVVLGDGAAAHRPALEKYDVRFLDTMISVVTSATLVTYALYTVSEDTVRRLHTHGLTLTFPFVLYGISRYLYLVYRRDVGGDPTEDLLGDRPTVINTALWVIATGLILYGPGLGLR